MYNFDDKLTFCAKFFDSWKHIKKSTLGNQLEFTDLNLLMKW